jgi:uncharacterized membrane protein
MQRRSSLISQNRQAEREIYAIQANARFGTEACIEAMQMDVR